MNDHITGEIKSLELGLMRFSTDDAGTFDVEWDEVYQIWSNHFYEVYTRQGLKFYGVLDSTGPGLLLVRSDTVKQNLRMMDVVEITPLERSFLKRIDGHLDVGFSYSKR